MTHESDCLAILDLDVDPLEHRDVRLGWVAELDIFEVDLTMISAFLSLSNLFLVKVADLFLGLSDEHSNLVEGSLNLGNLLQVAADTHDVKDDLPGVEQVGSHLTRGQLVSLNSSSAEVCRSDHASLDEEDVTGHHDCVVARHVLSNVEHAVV